MLCRVACVLPLVLIAVVANAQQESHGSFGATDPRELANRGRYVEALLRNPFQDQAFEHAYEGYLTLEGLDAWVGELRAGLENTDESSRIARLIILGRIQARRFKTAEAVEALEQARALGEARPEFLRLLGTLYADAGKDDQAIEILSQALDGLADPELRARVCRILGNVYLRRGKRDEAAATWRRLIEANPDDLFARQELAEIYEDNRLWSEAVAEYRAIAAGAAHDPYQRCRALRSIGDAYRQLDDPANAIAAYEQALDLAAPGNWLYEDVKRRLIAAYDEQGDLDGFVQYLQARVDAAPADPRYRELLAETLARRGDFEGAEAQWRAVIERAPSRPRPYEQLIALYLRMEQPGRAVETYESLIPLFPDEFDYLRRLGELYVQQGDIEQAKATWRRVIAAKDAPESHALIAQWFEQHGFDEDAVAHYEAALAQKKQKDWSFRLAALKYELGAEDEAVALWQATLDPETSTAADYVEVAALLESHGRLDEAEGLLRAALERDSDNAEHRLKLADLLARRGQHDEAASLYQHVADDADSEFLRSRGERGLLDAYAALGILEEKQAEWEREVAERPEDAATVVRLARLYERAGNRRGAIDLYLKAVDLEPDKPEHRLALARAYQTTRQVNKAVEVYETLVERDKPRAAVYDRELLQLYLNANRRDQAIATAERLVERAPGDAEARMELAHVYTTFQEPEKALEQYRFAVRRNPKEPRYFAQFGEALANTGLWGEAQEAYRKMMEAATDGPTRVAAVEQLARIYAEQGRFQELVQEFQDQLRRNPKRFSAYEELAAVHRSGGDVLKGVEVLESALDAVEDREGVLRRVLVEASNAGDLEKVVNAYEGLIALAGAPTVYELERLGSAYAQLGRIDKALETWKRIPEVAPNDPRAYKTLSKVFRAEGLPDENLEAQRKALELDPYDYRQRLQYASELASNDRVGDAIDELRTLLRLGEKPQPADASETPAELAPTTAPAGLSLRRGGFEEARARAVRSMVSYARQAGRVDEVIGEFRRSAGANPESDAALEDLMLAYETAEMLDAAIETAEKMLERAPEDVRLLQRAAMFYQRQQKLDKAVEKMERVAELVPRTQPAGRYSLVPLYIQTGRTDKARAIIRELREEFPDDPGTVFQLATFLHQLGDLEDSETAYRRAAELNPQYRNHVANVLASMRLNRGDLDGAWDLYEEMLFETTALTVPVTPRGAAQLYVPATNPQVRAMNVRSVTQLAGNLRVGVDMTRAAALDRLVEQPRGERPRRVVDRLKGIAENYPDSVPPDERPYLFEMGKLLILHHLSQGANDDALALRQRLFPDPTVSLEAANLALFIHERRGNYQAMESLYQELERRYPGQGRYAAIGRATAALLRNDYDTVEQLARAMAAQGAPQDDVLNVLGGLNGAGKHEISRRILEDLLAGADRNDRYLAALANVYAAQGDFERAMKTAREAWEAGGGARGSGAWQAASPARAPRNRGAGYLNLMHSYAQRAGKADELVREFEEQLERQPGAVPLYEGLISLYQMRNERGRVIELYRALLERRPNLTAARLEFAQLLTQYGETAEALAVYRELLRLKPDLYRTVGYQVRQLYEGLGNAEELAQFEEELLRRAPGPDQAHVLAQQAANRQDWARAIELYRLVIERDPSRAYVYNELANAQQQAGDRQGALDSLLKLYRSPNYGYRDFSLAQRIVALHAEMGTLDAFEAEVARTLDTAPNDGHALALRVQIARHKQRYDEAMDLLERIASTDPQPFLVYNEMVALAELKGDLNRAIQLLETRMPFQGGRPFGRLADLYLRKGDVDKAVENWLIEARQQGGAYGYARVFESLIQYKLYDKAQTFYAEYRREAEGDPIAGRQMDNALVRAHLDTGRFEDLVYNRLFATVGEYTPELVRMVVHHPSTGRAKGRVLLERLLERAPDNESILRDYAELLRNDGDSAKAAEMYGKLARDHPENAAYRQDYCRLLQQLGRFDELSALLAGWLREGPTPYRVQEIAAIAAQTDRPAVAVELYRAVSDTLDEAGRRTVAVALAPQLAMAGDVGAAKAALDAARADGDQQALERYLDFLVRWGYAEEALRTFEANKSLKFRLDHTGQNAALAALLVEHGAVEDAINLALVGLAAAKTHERDQALQHLAAAIPDKALFRSFLRDFERRLEKETIISTALLRAVANAYRSLGDLDRALELYEWLWAQKPADDDLLYQRFGLLTQLDRTEDLVALLEQLLQNATTQRAYDYAARLAPLYKDAGRLDDAITLLDGLPRSREDVQTYARVARMYASIGLNDRAVPMFEEIAATPEGRRSVAYDLVRGYIELGRVDAAAAVWENEKDVMGFANLSTFLLDKGRPDVARSFIEEELRKNPAQFHLYRSLARVAILTGDEGGYRHVFERGYQALAPNAREPLVQTYAAFLQDGGLLREFLEKGPLDTDLERWVAALNLKSVPTEDRQVFDRVRDRLDAWPAAPPPAAFALARAFASLGDPGRAEVWRKRLLEDPEDHAYKAQIAYDLLYEGRHAWAVEVFDAVVRDPTDLIDHHDGLLRALAGVAEETAAPVLERIDKLCLFDSHRAYYRARYDYYRLPKEAALPAVHAAGLGPDLTFTQVFRLANTLANEGRLDWALELFNRLLDGGSEAQMVNAQALPVVIDACLNAGRVAEAVRYWARSLPAEQSRALASRNRILAAAKSADLDAVRAAVEEDVRRAPAHHRASELVLLYAEMARRLGQNVSADALADSFGLNGRELDDVRLWTKMITAWALSPPVRLARPADMRAELPADVRALLEPGAPIPADRGWTRIGPERVSGLVNPADVLGLNAPEAAMKAVYAVTDLEAPEAREAAFAIGADDWARVWINGALVYANYAPGDAIVDRARFTAPLRAGKNRVVIRAGNHQQQWAFSLSLLDGAEALTAHAP